MVRSHPEWERPYTGIVELASGEIAEDMTKYLAESEQQNAAIALGVSINKDASIRAAGGFLVQVGHKDRSQDLQINFLGMTGWRGE